MGQLHPELVRELVTRELEAAEELAAYAKARGLPPPSLEETIDECRQRLGREELGVARGRGDWSSLIS